MATNRNYSITLSTLMDMSGAQKDYESFKKQIESKQIKLNPNSKGVKDATAGVRDLDGALRNQDQTLGANLLTFQAANMILSKTVGIVSAVVEQVYELNTAQTEFKKVSDLTGASLDNYTQKLSEMGRKVARTSTEMTEAATQFRKNSFSDEDSANLALVSTMYQNVADDAISARDSASFIIAMMKAFNVEAKDSVQIIDAVNEVANNFSVSSADIATALPKVSATLAQSGNTMAESIGLLVSATEMMPGNASRVARGLRTITLNLQGMNDEGEKNFELVAKLKTQFDKIRISLVDNNGQMRSTYDILYDLNGIWGNLDKNTRLYIAELIAGKDFCPFGTN